MKDIYALTPEKREEFSRHLMPCLKRPGGLSLRGGEGIYIEDLDGKRYMDFTSEQFVCLLGFGNAEVARPFISGAKYASCSAAPSDRPSISCVP